MKPLIESALVLFVLTAAGALLLPMLLPWWTVTIIGLAAGLVSRHSPWKTGLIVFAGVGITWLLLSLYITLTTSPVLLPRIATLLELPGTWAIFAVTVLIGALPASIAAAGASLLRPEPVT